MALDSRLIRICRSRFSSVCTTSGRRCGAVVAELDALGGRLQAEHVDELVEEIAQVRTSLRLSWKRPASIFEMSSRPSIRPDRCSALRRITLIGVDPPRRNRRVALQELRVAEDGIERRAQLVAEPTT